MEGVGESNLREKIISKVHEHVSGPFNYENWATFMTDTSNMGTKKDSTFLSQIILQRLRLPLAEWPRPLGLPFRQFARAGQEKMTPTSIRQEVITKKVSKLKKGLEWS